MKQLRKGQLCFLKANIYVVLENGENIVLQGNTEVRFIRPASSLTCWVRAEGQAELVKVHKDIILPVPKPTPPRIYPREGLSDWGEVFKDTAWVPEV